MSILIKGMKMPRSCHECVAGYGMSCFVCPPEEDGECPDQGRASWCPLVEIPPHGDLIDRDETMNEIFEARQCYDAADFAGVVNAMPSIIESEEEE